MPSPLQHQSLPRDPHIRYLPFVARVALRREESATAQSNGVKECGKLTCCTAPVRSSWFSIKPGMVTCYTCLTARLREAISRVRGGRPIAPGLNVSSRLSSSFLADASIKPPRVSIVADIRCGCLSLPRSRLYSVLMAMQKVSRWRQRLRFKLVNRTRTVSRAEVQDAGTRMY